MKKLLFILLMACLGVSSQAQNTFTVDSLTRWEVTNLRNRMQSMFTDSLAFENDTLLQAVRGINRQLRQRNSNTGFVITVPRRIAVAYFNTFSTQIRQIEGEEKLARETLRRIAFQKKIIKDAYYAEKAAGVTDANSMFRDFLIFSENRRQFFLLFQ